MSASLPIDGLERYQELRRMQAASKLPVAERRRRAEEIAARAAQRYREAEYLEFTFHSFEWPKRRAVMRMRMARGKLRSEVFLDRFGWERPALVYTMSDGMFREWSHIPGYERQAEYAATVPNGSAMPKVDQGSPAIEYGCMTGSSLVTWVGPEADGNIGRVFREIAAAGEWVGQVDLGGHTCDAILRESGDANEKIALTLYFGQDNYLRGYDTITGSPGGDVQLERQRRYTNLSVSAPPGKWWEYEPVRPSSEG